MPNTRAAFITNLGLGHGSSLYCVTAHWIIRCSGNNAGSRNSTTFIRRRNIEYIHNGQSYSNPALGSFPREGEHDGNSLSEILNIDNLPNIAPNSWIAQNGVSWNVAVQEIDAAMEYARRTQRPRASRVVGQGEFSKD